MSRNIEQVYIDNPSTTASPDDLFYKGNTPYGLTDDSAIKFSDLQTQLFQQNRLASYQNFGQGGRSAVQLDDTDFAGGPYVLTNPCPNIISLNCSIGGHTLQFPSAQGQDSFELYNGPEIINIGSANVSIVSFLGIPQTPSLASSHRQYFLIDNSTTGGLWDAQGIVSSINGETGEIDLVAGANVNITPNLDGTITIAASGGTGPVTSGQSAFVVTANPTDTTFSAPNQTKPIVIDPSSFSSIISTNFTNFVSSGTPTTQLLETGTKPIFFNATLSMKMSTGIQNTYLFYLVIRTSPSTTITTTYQAEVSLTPLSTGLVSIPLNGILPMSQNNSVEIWVTNLGGTDPLQIVSLSAQAYDLTQQGYASTDDLIQGSSNLYLSQNGGTTYQNVTTPVTIGNVASFDTVGGHLVDAGLQVGQANTISTLQASTNTDFYPVFVGSTTNSYQQIRLSTGWSFNPNSNKMTLPAMQLSGLSAGSTLIGSDSGKNLEAATGFYTLSGLTLNNGGGALLGTAAPLVFPSSLSVGNYANFGGSGRNIGVDNSGDFFVSYNADFDPSIPSFKYVSNGAAFAIAISSSGIALQNAMSGTAGNPLGFGNALLVQSNGSIQVSSLSASQLVATDGSSNLVSLPNYGITAAATVTGSSQAMSFNTRYTNNYAGGQCAYTLPASTGSKKSIVLVSLTTASTSGWKITANGTDKIQFMGVLGASGSVLTSTIGSAVDCATLTDEASGLWTVYPAAGLNLTVT